MTKLTDIAKFLDKELNVKKVKDVSKNGLQIRGNLVVKKIGFSVDSGLEVMEKAKKEGCDLIIVHHGLFWKKQKYSDNILNKRISYLKKNKISFYAAHLPLDTHKTWGNSKILADMLGLKKQKKFAKYDNNPCGVYGELNKTINMNQLKMMLDKRLVTKTVTYSFGKKSIKRIGIVSGGGGKSYSDAKKLRLDCFITGEVPHGIYHPIKESQLNVIAAGHYATETLGVKALMPVLKKRFSVETVFIDCPTDL